MPIEIIIDNWNPRGRKKYRFETFCYGPLGCKLYKAGPNRKVEGRNGIVYIEEDWVDGMNVEHRDPDEQESIEETEGYEWDYLTFLKSETIKINRLANQKTRRISTSAL
ncbi:hypothetical protein [Irregularibacter muris]|uniref:hypothetical protein n=1 Tax=Irregularibacter muris TaxID=1796619 RepID=UPI00214B62FE|nr:hypothetical protein [Irregularibacter muris]